MATSPARGGDSPKVFRLKKQSELRVEVTQGSDVMLKLKEGRAEIFGTELSKNQVYKFSCNNFAVFTWHDGCVLELTGQCHAYPADETPMVTYLNVHSVLQSEREAARVNNTQGPRVMVVGQTDTGKTTLCKLLIGYATREGETPVFVDLDVGQGSISLPGTIGALPVDRPVDIEEGFALTAPLIYYFGHVTPSANRELFEHQVDLLGKQLDQRMETNEKARASGCVINTCGWVDGMGYELLLHSIKALKVQTVLVIDHERMCSDLQSSFASAATPLRVVKLRKSGGVVVRPNAFRREARNARIKSYFYGGKDKKGQAELCPAQIVVDLRRRTVYNIGGGPQAPAGALPAGQSATYGALSLEPMPPQKDMMHSVLALVHANSEKDVINGNVAGFLHVTDVKPERGVIHCTAPCPGPLPSKFLIAGTLKYME